MSRYGEIEVFSDIEPIHVKVHDVGRDIIELCQADSLPEAHKKAAVLLELKDSILDRLAMLQKHVAKKISL